MAEVTLASSSAKQVWSTKYLSEYVRLSGFMPYMGRSPNSIFQIITDLESSAGSTVNIPLLTRLKGQGVSGAQVLVGNEEDLGNFNAQVVINWLRNGVVVPKSTQYLTEIDLLNAAKPMLKTWSGEQLRDAIIAALGSIIIPGATGVQDTVVAYADATAGQRNTYLTNNADRILFGASKANAVSGIWATALGNIDSPTDKLSTPIASLAKRMARTADPHITPFKTDGGREYYVMFCNPWAFRDLKQDTAMLAANRDARPRDVESNPIFQDGDMIYDGIIFREIPELTQLTIVGAGSGPIDVAQNFLCGQQAVGIAYGQQPTPRTDMNRDYGFRPGVAIEELRGQRKLSFNGVQYGVVTVLTAGVADA
jgi:N4-gp56 family major capsid protein